MGRSWSLGLFWYIRQNLNKSVTADLWLDSSCMTQPIPLVLNMQYVGTRQSPLAVLTLSMDSCVNRGIWKPPRMKDDQEYMQSEYLYLRERNQELQQKARWKARAAVPNFRRCYEEQAMVWGRSCRWWLGPAPDCGGWVLASTVLALLRRRRWGRRPARQPVLQKDTQCALQSETRRYIYNEA